MASFQASRHVRRVMRTLLPRVASTPGRQHNMHEHDGERYYYEQYMAVLAPLLQHKQRVLDVGCQYGRFLLPMTEQGHEVIGTDLDATCLDYIRERSPGVDLRQESAEQTAQKAPAAGFDLVLCLELLYLLPDWQQILAGLGRQVASGGRLVASHRSQGYYIHRLLHERRYDELDQILAGHHPALNAQSPDELRAAYEAARMTVESITAIGAFTGIDVDPFAAINDPTDLGPRDQQQLMRYETDPALCGRFLDNARYLLVVAAPR